MKNTILQGDVIQHLATIESDSIQCCVTSPPYWGLRDYGVDGQLGLEKTPEEYVANMVEVFREVRRVLKPDGVLWLNLGDSYAGSGKGASGDGIVRLTEKSKKQITSAGTHQGKFNKTETPTLKPKDLVGIPWRVAFALQADGWWLRQDIIWAKPNPMPESVTDRCTKSHEYIFMLTKSARYYYDNEAIKEPGTMSSIERLSQNVESQIGSDRVPGKTNGTMKAVGKLDKQRGHVRRHEGFNDRWDNMTKEEQCALKRNKRSVWTVATRPYKGAHFATFPEKLIEPCILATSRVGDTVLDPFGGSGTTGAVAKRLGRDYLLVELNPRYIALANERISAAKPPKPITQIAIEFDASGN